MHSRITTIMRNCLEAMNANREIPIDLNQIDKLALFGENGVFDSMQLVNFLLLVEEGIQDELGHTISLTSERAVSRRVSPFQSTEHLLAFVLEELDVAAVKAA